MLSLKASSACRTSLIIVLFSFLSDKDDQLETALIDSSFPDFNLGSLSDESRLLTKRDIIKLPALINVWATWCIACRVEHPFLMKLKEENRKLKEGNVNTDYVKENGMGNIDIARMEKALGQLAETYEFSSDPEISSFFTDKYLP